MGLPPASASVLQVRSILQAWQWRSSLGRQDMRAMASATPGAPVSAHVSMSGLGSGKRIYRVL